MSTYPTSWQLVDSVAEEAIGTGMFDFRGSHVWLTKGSGSFGEYDANAWTILTSPVINLSGTVSPIMSFWMYMFTESASDGMCVQFSIDGGTTWANLASANFSTAYDTNLDNGDAGVASFYAWTGTRRNWQQIQVNLASFANQANFRLRFYFVSDRGVNLRGAAVDDVLIYDKPSYVSASLTNHSSGSKANGSASITASASTSATMRAKGSLAASIAASASLSATLPGKVRGTGSVAGVASLTAALTSRVSIASSVTATATLSATARAKGDLLANITNASSLTGLMQAKGSLNGNVAAQANVTGTVGQHGGLSANISVFSSLSASLTGKARSNGSVTGIASVSAAISSRVGISSNVLAVSTLTGNLGVHGVYTATSTGSASTSATMRAKAVLAASLTSVSNVGGTLGGRTDLHAFASGSSSNVAQLLAKGALSGVSGGIAVPSGFLEAKAANAISATVAAESSAFAILTGKGNLFVSVDSVALVSGTISSTSIYFETLAVISQITTQLQDKSTINNLISERSLI